MNQSQPLQSESFQSQFNSEDSKKYQKTKNIFSQKLVYKICDLALSIIARILTNMPNWQNFCRVSLTEPQVIQKVWQQISKAVNKRYKQKYNKKRQFSQKQDNVSSYEQAKVAQTTQRDLQKALILYAESCSKAQKIDSCIKDVASIMHQLGRTKDAVNFLQEMRKFYQGDLNKYDRLFETLQKQLKPSGKHECRALLLELPQKSFLKIDLVTQMFENVSRIKEIKIFSHMAFNEPTESQGKWLVLCFESFSAAKKTLEKFKYDQWFGVNKFWLKGNQVICEAIGGRQDFENGFVLEQRQVEKCLKNANSDFWLWSQAQYLHMYNTQAVRMIEEDIYQQECKKIIKIDEDY